MKLPRLRTVLLTPLVLFALFYIAVVIKTASTDDSIEILAGSPATNETIAIFGASGTAGTEYRYLTPGLLASVYFSAGDADRGFALFNQALNDRSREMIFLQVSEMLRGYRDDPRYLELVEKVGLQ